MKTCLPDEYNEVLHLCSEYDRTGHGNLRITMIPFVSMCSPNSALLPSFLYHKVSHCFYFYVPILGKMFLIIVVTTVLFFLLIINIRFVKRSMSHFLLLL